MTAIIGDALMGEAPAEEVSVQPEQPFVIGKTASELDAVFQAQSEAIKADPGLKFERTVHYALVECDTELQRIPLDALSLGLSVRASQDDPDALDENFIFSLLLATGTLSRCTIDVGPNCTVDPQLVLNEAEAQGLNVRLMLPPSPETVDAVVSYVDRLESYSALWLSMSSGNFSLTPLDGYLEYKFSVALGHTPKEITNNREMKLLFTDEVPVEVMDYIKARLDQVIERELGGDDFFVSEAQKLGGALRLKEAELREARKRMLEEELDARTPVPNLIRATSKMTGLSIPDAAGLIYELKNSFHSVLDKYLPKEADESLEDYTPSRAQKAFAHNLVSALGGAFGGADGLLGAWDQLSAKSQLKQLVDLDRGAVEPSPSARGAAEVIGVDGKVAALAAAEFVGMLGSILKAGGAISEIGLEKPQPVAEPVSVQPASNIIAVG
ncbi:hypothetical protein N0609_12705 [Pseudomonas aeruginosa]|nr:hypothetical protein [Pseudomonas aeruginosa]MCS8510144.1 hypothetical protein [Pseudomonas aeruginosa]MCS8541348.1 hypothetical protein [Pseudomonas aeruginosa]MCT0600494.1 hypothetical protein [Pseudomonas aeruginosa]